MSSRPSGTSYASDQLDRQKNPEDVWITKIYLSPARIPQGGSTLDVSEPESLIVRMAINCTPVSVRCKNDG